MRGPGPEQGLLFGALEADPEPAPPPAKPKVPPRPKVSLELEPWLVSVPAAIPLPRTIADCRQPPTWDEATQQWHGGACPKWFCEQHVIGRVIREADAETIVVGSRGGTGRGASLAATRNARGKVTMAQLDALVDMGIAISDSIPSDCADDYANDGDLLGGTDDVGDDPGAIGAAGQSPHMTLSQVGRVFNITREAVRRTELNALLKLRRLASMDDLHEEAQLLEALRSKRERTAPASGHRSEDRDLKPSNLIPATSLARKVRP